MNAVAAKTIGSTIIPDGDSLSTTDIAEAARDFDRHIELTPEIRERVIASRALLDKFVESGRVIYGVTTSVGGFVNWLVPPSHAEETQNNIMRSVHHGCRPPELLPSPPPIG